MHVGVTHRRGTCEVGERERSAGVREGGLRGENWQGRRKRTRKKGKNKRMKECVDV